MFFLDPKEILIQKQQGLKLTRLTYLTTGVGMGVMTYNHTYDTLIGKIAFGLSALTFISSIYRTNNLKFDVEELEEYLKTLKSIETINEPETIETIEVKER